MTAAAIATKHRVAVGESLLVEMPASEVCMHLRVAGKAMIVRLVSENSAQLLDAAGQPWSLPITPGEAGLYRDAVGFYVLPEVLRG